MDIRTYMLYYCLDNCVVSLHTHICEYVRTYIHTYIHTYVSTDGCVHADWLHSHPTGSTTCINIVVLNLHWDFYVWMYVHTQLVPKAVSQTHTNHMYVHYASSDYAQHTSTWLLWVLVARDTSSNQPIQHCVTLCPPEELKVQTSKRTRTDNRAMGGDGWI